MLELGDGAASGARDDQLEDAQDVERHLFPIHFHTRCFKIDKQDELHTGMGGWKCGG